MLRFNRRCPVAWFGATVAAGAAGTKGETVAVGDPQTQVSNVSLPVKVTVTRTDGSTALEMGTWTTVDSNGLYNAGGTAGYYHAYLDANGVAHYQTTSVAKSGVTLAEFAYYTISIQAPANHLDANGDETDSSPVYAYVDGATKYTQDQIAEFLATTNAKFTLSRKTYSASEYKVSRAKFFAVSAANAALNGNETPTSTDTGNDAPGAVNITLGSKSELLSGKIYGVFALYVDGENKSGDDNVLDTLTGNNTKNAVTGDFVVTVAKQ